MFECKIKDLSSNSSIDDGRQTEIEERTKNTVTAETCPITREIHSCSAVFILTNILSGDL